MKNRLTASISVVLAALSASVASAGEPSILELPRAFEIEFVQDVVLDVGVHRDLFSNLVTQAEAFDTAANPDQITLAAGTVLAVQKYPANRCAWGEIKPSRCPPGNPIVGQDWHFAVLKTIAADTRSTGTLKSFSLRYLFAYFHVDAPASDIVDAFGQKVRIRHRNGGL